MTNNILSGLVCVILLSTSATVTASEEDEALKTFYTAVFGWDIDQAGQFNVSVTTPIDAAIRKDPAGNPLGLVEMDGNTPRIP